MAKKDKLQSKALCLDKDCPIQELLEKNEERISKINKRQGLKEAKKHVKKKALTKVKKIYSILPKVAISILLIVFFGSLIGSIIFPDVKDVIYTIFDKLDLLKPFRGAGSFEPDNYVMFLNNILWH